MNPNTSVRELSEKLQAIVYEQRQRSLKLDEKTTLGGITATRDKLEAIALVLDYCGQEIEEWFEEIR